MENSRKIGITLSGGGLRAAVFQFGLLNRLARDQQLEDITFLSTVSGGSLAIALIFALNNGAWPASDTFLNDTTPKLRELLTTVHLQRSLYLRCAYKFWRALFSRANLMAEAIRDRWDINLSLKDLPDTPRWLINATCYETGKSWRFDKKRMGDYQFGYVINPDCDVADAIAASAALPMLIGPFELNTANYKWHKFGPDRGDDFISIAPMLKRVHLWDGGIYENLGLESLYKMDTGPRAGIDYLIVSDAGAPLRIKQSRLAAYLRLIDIGMSQIRGLRSRAVVNYFKNHPNTGLYIQLGNTVNEIIHRAKVQLNSNINCEMCLTSQQVKTISNMKTHVKRLSELEFDLLHQHGYEVADTTMFCYSPTLYSHTPYDNGHCPS